MIVSYDVNTVDASGRRRLRRVAKACLDCGIRVQNSVFECYLDWTQWIVLKAKLESICDPAVDSLRYYNMGNNYNGKVLHFGAKTTVDPVSDALLV